MKATLLKQAGTADAMHLGEIERPSITQPNQILVRLKAAAINPIDTKIRQTPERFPITMPAILGCDGAGIIEAVGDGVTNYKVGDEVYYCQCGFNGRQGNYAEYAVVDSCFVAHKPTSLSFEEAAAVPLVMITAWEALYDRVTINPGDKVLIHAGTGGVGHIALQLAKAAGADVAVTISSDKKAEVAKQLGADKTINYKQENFVETINQWTNHQGVDIALDTVGGKLIEQTFAAVKVYGDLLTILQPATDVNWGVARKRNLRFTQILMLTPTMMELDTAKTHQGEILQEAAKLFDSGKLTVKIAKIFELEDTPAAHQHLENEHPIGKVVLKI